MTNGNQGSENVLHLGHPVLEGQPCSEVRLLAARHSANSLTRQVRSIIHEKNSSPQTAQQLSSRKLDSQLHGKHIFLTLFFQIRIHQHLESLENFDSRKCLAHQILLVPKVLLYSNLALLLKTNLAKLVKRCSITYN